MADTKKKKLDATTYDKRTVERYVQRGVLSRADVETHLKNLPDLEEQADNIAEMIYPGGAAPVGASQGDTRN